MLPFEIILLFSLPIFVDRHDRSHLLTITYNIETFSAKIFLLEHIRKWGTFLLTKASPSFAYTESAQPTHILYYKAKSKIQTYFLHFGRFCKKLLIGSYGLGSFNNFAKTLEDA